MKRLLLLVLLLPALAWGQEAATVFPPDQVGPDAFTGGTLTSDLVLPPGEYVQWDTGSGGTPYPLFGQSSTASFYLLTHATNPRARFILSGNDQAPHVDEGSFQLSVYNTAGTFSLISADSDAGAALGQHILFKTSSADTAAFYSGGMKLASGDAVVFLDNANIANWTGANSISLAAAAPSGNTTVTLPALTGTVAIGVSTGALAFDPGNTVSGTCAAAITDTATGALTTDVISWTFSADPTSTAGYDPSGDLGYIVAYPTADVVNFKFCNKSGSDIDPGAVTLNWRIDR